MGIITPITRTTKKKPGITRKNQENQDQILETKRKKANKNQEEKKKKKEEEKTWRK